MATFKNPLDLSKFVVNDTNEDLVYKVFDKLKNDINSFDIEMETLSQIDGDSIDEIKKRDPMRIAKSLVDSGIITSKHFVDWKK